MTTYKTLYKEQFKTDYANTPTKELAIKYGVPAGTIRTWANKLKVVKANGRWEPAHEILLLKYYNDPAHPIADLAKLFNKTEDAIINKYRELTGKRDHLKGKYKKKPSI